MPPKHEQGGFSQARYQRHHEAHVHWHLERVVQRLAELFRQRRFDRLILAGPEEATSALRRLLPRALAHRLAAVIPAQLTWGEAEILTKTREVEWQIEREFEERVLQEVLDEAGPAGRSASRPCPRSRATTPSWWTWTGSARSSGSSWRGSRRPRPALGARVGSTAAGRWHGTGPVAVAWDLGQAPLPVGSA